MRNGRFYPGRILVGSFLIIIGVLWLLEMLGIIQFNICIIGPLILIIAGIGVMLRRPWDMW